MKIANSLVCIAFAAIIGLGVIALPLKTAVAESQATDTVSSVFNTNVLHIKFSESSQVQVTDGVFVSTSGQNLDKINNILTSANSTKKQKLFRASNKVLDQKHADAELTSGEYMANLNDYFRVQLRPGQNSQAISTKLKKLPYIIEAYPEPLPAAPPISPNYINLQKHLSSSPNGMGVTGASAQPGVRGDKVAIADLEYDWNKSHEDISDARATGSVIANGTPLSPFNDNNHGTAVAGVISGDHNSYGINGIAPDASLKLVNTYNAEFGWDLPSAIYTAQSKLSKGDVMLIEQQAWGPNGELLPVEWVPAVYDAIKLATASGIVVIEAAANSGVNLSNPIYGTKFPMGKPDSGAIMVGAGAACGYQANRSRLSFSNYGARLNVQGFGECVVTSGYGNLYSNGSNAMYTDSFNGTSSASATVAGVAAAISSAFEYENNRPIKPAEIKKILIKSGASQNNTINKGKIGPLPNLSKAITMLDLTKPTKPGNFSITLVNGKPVLNWNASTDNKAVEYYRIMRNNKQIATTKYLTYTDISAEAGSTYSYKIQAVDTSGNKSAATKAIVVTL